MRRRLSFLDLILNIVALLLWLNWRSSRLLTRHSRPSISISNSLKRTEPPRLRAWTSLAALPLLLLLRAFFYWDVGSNLNWTGVMDLGAISLHWRSDFFPRMLLFSLGSFALWLGALYSCLLLLSAANQRLPDSEPGMVLIRGQLGWPDKLPRSVKLLLPPIGASLMWVACFPLLRKIGMVPATGSKLHLWEQALVLGLSSLLVWRWVLIPLLFLHLLNTYLYLGEHPFWKFVSSSARNLLRPLAFLQFRFLDLSAFAALAVTLFVAHFGPPVLVQLFRRLPL
jgi:hypothetical protein